MTVEQLKKIYSDPYHAENLRRSPDNEDDLQWGVDYFAKISKGRHGTTKVSDDSGNTVYYYRGVEIERHDGTPNGYYGAWRSIRGWGDSLEDMIQRFGR